MIRFNGSGTKGFVKSDIWRLAASLLGDVRTKGPQFSATAVLRT